MSVLRKLMFSAWLEATEKSGRYTRTLQRWQREPPDVAARRAEARLSETLLHAHRHNAWHRRRLDAAGVIRGDAVRLEALRDLPILERDDLRHRFDDLACDDRIDGTYEINRSGGSTGEQVHFLQDKDYNDWRRAAQFLIESWAGYWYGMPKILLWGSAEDLMIGHETVRAKIGRWLRNETWLSAFDLTAERMAEYLDRIDAVKPYAIHAYADCIFELARAAIRMNRKVYRPRAVFTTAVTLFPHIREALEQAFGPTFNHYGAREVGPIAAETTDHDGLMVIAPINHLEILRPDGSPCNPGEPGEIIVTNLTNRTMPLIRYRIGDMASWKDPRSHAKVWPVMERLLGRTDDMIRLRDGRIIAPETMVYLLVILLNSDNWIERSQVHQESYDSIVVSLVLSPAAAASDALPRRIEEVAQAIRRAVHDMCRVDVRVVDRIAPSASGKYRAVTSSVAA